MFTYSQVCGLIAHMVPGSQATVLRSKGLKDAMCMGWFGNDWDCSVGSPPDAMITRVGQYWLPTLITSKSLNDKGNF